MKKYFKLLVLAFVIGSIPPAGIFARGGCGGGHSSGGHSSFSSHSSFGGSSRSSFSSPSRSSFTRSSYSAPSRSATYTKSAPISRPRVTNVTHVTHVNNVHVGGGYHGGYGYHAPYYHRPWYNPFYTPVVVPVVVGGGQPQYAEGPMQEQPIQQEYREQYNPYGFWYFVQWIIILGVLGTAIYYFIKWLKNRNKETYDLKKY